MATERRHLSLSLSLFSFQLTHFLSVTAQCPFVAEVAAAAAAASEVRYCFVCACVRVCVRVCACVCEALKKEESERREGK